MELKKEMARQVVAKFWTEESANAAKEQFEAVFQQRDYSKAKEVVLDASLANPVWIVDLLRNLGAIAASSEAKRLIEAKAVEIDGESVADFKASVAWKSGMTIKVGKHRIYQIK
jgi:tyrosyl-tRNA synthetase